MKRLVCVLLSGLFIINLCNAQTKDKTVATIGKKKISSDEYRVRYELMPHITQNNDLIDSIKFEFAYSLIAEKLWAMEASQMGYDTSDVIKYSMQSLEKLYVKDALYREEVEKKIKITPQEVIRGTFRYSTKLHINVISSGDSSEIFSLYSQIKSGAPFDSLLKLRDDYTEQKTPLTVSYGQMEDEAIEDTLYQMQIGSISYPMKTPDGWFIFKLNNKTSNVFDNSKSDKVSLKVKDIIHSRKARKFELEYLRGFMSTVKVTTNGHLFRRITEMSTPVLEKKASLPENKKGNVNLDENDVSQMMKQFGSDTLKMSFIRFEKDPITLRDFLFSFVTDGFTVKEPNYETVSERIRNYLNIFIENELLSREGYKRGLQNLPDVKNDMNWWKENYIAHLLRNQFLDSAKVTDEEVADYYKKTTGQKQTVTEVNLIEILTQSLQDIETIMNEAQAGKDFRELARIYNKRESSKNNDGETGLMPVTFLGEMGKIAENMKPGEVYGPLKLTEGYSIFKLIDKKQKGDSLTKSFDELKDRLKEDLFSQKLNQAFDKYTAKLANKYGVKLNEDVLKSIKVNEINMFTSRNMGFGGRIAAIPYTAPFFEWVKQWKKSRQYNP